MSQIIKMTPVKVKQVRERKQGEDLALFNIMTAEYTVLNKTAARILGLCDGNHRAADIAEILIKDFPEAPSLDEVVNDVCDTIELLIERGIIEKEVDSNG